MLVRAVEFSPRAEQQLTAVEVYYLKKAGPAVADRAVASIVEAAERLGSYNSFVLAAPDGDIGLVPSA